MSQENTGQEMIKVNEAEKKILKIVRGLNHGEITVKVQDGKPVLIEKVLKKIKC